MKANPGETVNPAGERPDMVAPLRETVTGPWTCASSGRTGGAEPEDAAQVTLRARGYVQ